MKSIASINRSTSVGNNIINGSKRIIDTLLLRDLNRELNKNEIKLMEKSKNKELNDKILEVSYSFESTDLNDKTLPLLSSSFLEGHNKNLLEIKEDRIKKNEKIKPKERQSFIKNIFRSPITMSNKIGSAINASYKYILGKSEVAITAEQLNINSWGKILGRLDNGNIISTEMMSDKDLTIEGVMSKLNILMNKHNPDSGSYTWVVNEFVYYYRNNSTSGGCIKTGKGGPPDKPNSIFGEKSKYKLVSFHSENNNCLFVVIAHFFNINSKVIQPNNVRKELGFEQGEMIGIEDVRKVFDYYNDIHIKNGGTDKGYLLSNEAETIISFKKPKSKIDDEFDFIEEFNEEIDEEFGENEEFDEIYNLNSKITDERIDKKGILNLMLYRDHYYMIEIKHKIKCGVCKKEIYKNEKGEFKHKCNVKVASYANNYLKLALKDNYKAKYEKKTGKYKIDLSDVNKDDKEKIKEILDDNKFVIPFSKIEKENKKETKKVTLDSIYKSALSKLNKNELIIDLSYKMVHQLNNILKFSHNKNIIYRDRRFENITRMHKNHFVDMFMEYVKTEIKNESYIFCTYNKKKSCVTLNLKKLNDSDLKLFKTIMNSIKQGVYDVELVKYGEENDKEEKTGVIHFDFETCTNKNKKIKRHQIYSVGYWFSVTNEYKLIYYENDGSNVVDKFMNDLKQIYIDYKDYNIILSAYNGSGYDIHFILEWLNRHNEKTSNLIIKDRRILRLDFWNFRTFDLCNFLMCKLSDACTDFNISDENAKSDFDHNKIIEIEDCLKYKDEITEYLRRDVMGLKELYDVFYDLIFEHTKIKITDCITISNLCYNYWTTLLKEIIEIPTFGKYKKYIHPAIFGARCNPFKKYFKSNYYDEVKKIHQPLKNELDKKERLEKEYKLTNDEEIKNKISEIKTNIEVIENDVTKILKDKYIEILKSGDFYINEDITSLYPSAMKGVKSKNVKQIIKTNIETPLYPVGKSREIYGKELCEQEFNNGKLGFYYIKFTPKNNIMFPPIPSSRYEKDKRIGVKYDLLPNEGFYTSVDIQNALDCKYDVIFGDEALIYDEKADIFSVYVEKFEKLKKQAEDNKNEALRSVAKLMLNSLYGKQIQAPILDNIKIIHSIEEFDSFVTEYDLDDFYKLNDEGKYIIKGISKDRNATVTKPSQNGAFILSYSRSIMLNYMLILNPNLDENIISYTDTDCFHLNGDILKDLEKMNIHKTKKDSEFGLFCSDIKNEGIILREMNLGPKCYMYESIDNKGNFKVVNKCKGIPEVFLKETIKENPNLYYDEKPVDICFNPELKPTFKKIGHNRNNQQLDYNYFDVYTVTDMSRTFNKQEWKGMKLIDNVFYPKGHIKIKE